MPLNISLCLFLNQDEALERVLLVLGGFRARLPIQSGFEDDRTYTSVF